MKETPIESPANRMIQEFSAYPDWKAPGEDSALVIWPEPEQILRDAIDNHQRLAAERSCIVQGVALGELRRRQRSELKLSDDSPVIATGHQTELFHPGVWGKLAMIDAIGRRMGGDCLFAAVDSDAPKHLQLRWPGKSRPITDDPGVTSAPWCGMLDAPSREYIGELKSALSAAAEGWSFEPMIFELLNDLGEQAPRKLGLSTALTAAMYWLDWELGLRHQSILVSRLWMSEPYLALAHHLLAHAEDFAQSYNGALKEYRAAHGIDDPGRPMPDLQISGERCEAPFWLDDQKKQARRRAAVEREGMGWRLVIDADSFELKRGKPGAAGELREFLSRHNMRLSPRALTLTMFFRLLIADQWVHGIGGGRYEQVNDRVIRRFFGIEAPAFSVTTATLYFPDAVGRTRACVPCVAHEGHRLRHAVMGPAKMEMVQQIASLPRRSIQRQKIFSEMHTQRAQAVRIDPSITTWQQRMSEATRRSVDEQGMFDRELFYAIQPRQRLVGLIEQYAGKFARG
jgi:hypothetical protein